MKECRDCKFCKLHWTDYFFLLDRFQMSTCSNPDVSHSVDDIHKVGGIFIGSMPTNHGELCVLARKSYGACGPDAKYFEEKVKWF